MLYSQGIDIHIAHASGDFIGDCMQRAWTSSKVAMKYRNKEITADSLLEEIHKYLKHDVKCREMIGRLECGVYIFGHSHIQWSWQSEDRNVTLINPGSCGLPLDGKKNSIPYTILEIHEDGQVSVEEKRIPFDMEEYIQTIRKSDQFKYANVWTKIIEKELKAGLEHLYFFLRYVEKYANKIGDMRSPYAVDTWEKAYELWEAEFKTYE